MIAPSDPGPQREFRWDRALAVIAVVLVLVVAGEVLYVFRWGDASPTKPPKWVSVNSAFKVSLRPSVLGQGAVLQLTSRANGPASITISVFNNDSRQGREYRLELLPSASAEVGPLEMGWTFQPNESLQIFAYITPGGGLPDVIARQSYVLYKASNGGVGIRGRFLDIL
jgi:hypothetical protein